jgi:hypothetical protein
MTFTVPIEICFTGLEFWHSLWSFALIDEFV